MSDMRLNRLFNKPVRTDVTTKKAQKKAETSAGGSTGQPGAKSSFEQPMERRLDTLMLSEQARATAQARSTKEIIGGAPQRSSGESDEHWMRRLISYETASAWRANSRQWQEESKGMGIVESVRYQGQKATEWVTGLMEREPAMFREWLNREAWHMEEGDLDNAILPKGFTKEDMARWMEKDVLEYL